MFMRSQIWAPLLFLGVGVSSTADAEFYSFVASNCVEENNQIRYPARNARPTSNIARIKCPLLRRSPDSASITAINVAVQDSNAGTITCFASSQAEDSVQGTSTAAVSTGAAFTGFTTLFLGSIQGFTNGTVEIQCTMDNANSGLPHSVTSYRWND